MSGPTLGEVIRGARLGWGWCTEIRAFLRIEDAPSGWLVDVRPFPPKGKTDLTREFRVWWPEKDHVIGRAVRRAVAGDLRAVTVRRPLRFVLDDFGNPVAALGAP